MKFANDYKYKKEYLKLIYGALFFYAFVIAIKLAYSAQMVEIISYYKSTKSLVALGPTIYYAVYSVAQVVLGIFIHKINLKRYLIITTILSAISFSFIGLTSDLWQVWLIFGLNGILQSASWGGINYILCNRLPNGLLPYANKIVITGFAIGNSLTYAVSALCVEFLSWKLTFAVLGTIFILSLFNLIHKDRLVAKVNAKGDEIEEKIEPLAKHTYVIPQGKKFNVKMHMAIMALLAFGSTSLMYAFCNWIPNILVEIHNFPVSLSILITLIVPLVDAPAKIISYSLYDKTNKVYFGGALSGFATMILLGVMIFVYDTNLILVIIMCVLLKFFTAFFFGTYCTYTIMKYKNYVNVARETLINNALASFGAGIMPFIGALVMDLLNWKAYFIFLTGFALLTTLIALVLALVVKIKRNVSEYV